MNRTDRLLGILLAFQARRDLRAEDLSSQFEVSVRTIYRDIQALSETGVPIAAMPGTGYRLLDGYFLPPLSFTADEAAILTLGGQFIRDRVDHELSRVAGEALQKLLSILPADRRRAVEQWQEDLRFLTFRDRSDTRELGELRLRIQQRRVIRLLYHTRGRPSPEWRDVEPVSLVYAGSAWCVAAYCRLRQAPRLFRLDRIDQLEVLAERFTLESRHLLDPDCSDPLAHYPEARVQFEPRVERWVRERQPFTFLREERGGDGSIFVYAVRDELELLSWFLSWGAAVEVLDPPWLQERFITEIRSMLSRHVPFDDRSMLAPACEREKHS
jgi:predicted DNA-binding transcriptional regulator YafY